MALKDIWKNRGNEPVILPEDDVDYPNDIYSDDDTPSGLITEDTGASIEMKVVKPTSYKIDEVKQYGDLLLERKTVLLNLESTSLEDARRLLDFLSGVVHAVDGKIEKVGKKTFVATPHNVDVTGSADFSDEDTEER